MSMGVKIHCITSKYTYFVYYIIYIAPSATTLKGSGTMKDFYKTLVKGIDPTLTVTRIVKGKSWTGAELSNGSFGIAMYTEGSSIDRMYDSLLGLPAKDAAKGVMSWNLEEASEAMAVINAFYNSPDRMKELEIDVPFERVCTVGLELKGKTVAFIGHLKMPPETVEGCKNLYIIERDPREGDYPDSACEYLLPQCDIVIITGSACVNKTMPRLLELSRNAETILIGPTVPMCPKLKELGVDRLSGMAVRDKDGIIDWMQREAGSPYPYGDTFLII